MKHLSKGDILYISGIYGNLHELADKIDPKREYKSDYARKLTQIAILCKEIIVQYEIDMRSK